MGFLDSPAVVTASGSVTFDVLFNPTTTGSKTATITIDNNDSNEGSYEITLTGTGIAPDTTPPAEVTGLTATAGNAQVTLSWTDPTDVDFDHVEITLSPATSTYTVSAGTETKTITGLTNGTSTSVTFTIRNIGTSSLTVSSVTLTGTNASEFSLNTSSIPAVVTASGSVTFDVTFNPSTTGSKSATMTINNNDSDEGSYEITLNGFGQDITPPDPLHITAITENQNSITITWEASSEG